MILTQSSETCGWLDGTIRTELDLLESVMFFRRILNAPKYTSKEMFYLELGAASLREIIRQRKLNFLKYIIEQGADSMLFKVFEKQCQNRTTKDWVTTVLNDLEILGMKTTFADIQKTNKTQWKNIVKIKVKEHAFKVLEEMIHPSVILTEQTATTLS